MKLKNKPNKLKFKFRDISDYTIDMIQNGNYWFTQISELNDPFEGDFKITDENISVIKSHSIEQRVDIIKSFRENVRRQLYVHSLSNDWRDIVMWSHYAAFHSGVCIGVEIDNKFQNIDSRKGSIVMVNNKIAHRVKYSNNPIVLDISAESSEREIIKACLQKSTQWKYEKEYRLIYHSESIRNKGTLINMGKQSIKKVIFGARVSGKIIEETIRRINREDIDYKKAIINHGDFKITLVKA